MEMASLVIGILGFFASAIGLGFTIWVYKKTNDIDELLKLYSEQKSFGRIRMGLIETLSDNIKYMQSEDKINKLTGASEADRIFARIIKQDPDLEEADKHKVEKVRNYLSEIQRDLEKYEFGDIMSDYNDIIAMLHNEEDLHNEQQK